MEGGAFSSPATIHCSVLAITHITKYLINSSYGIISYVYFRQRKLKNRPSVWTPNRATVWDDEDIIAVAYNGLQRLMSPF